MPEGRGDGQGLRRNHRYQARPCMDAQGILPAIVIRTEPSPSLGPRRGGAPGRMGRAHGLPPSTVVRGTKTPPAKRSKVPPRGQAATTPQVPAPKLGVGDDRTTKAPAQRAPHPLRVACASPASLQTYVRRDAKIRPRGVRQPGWSQPRPECGGTGRARRASPG
jgi:hypothetical protein